MLWILLYPQNIGYNTSVELFTIKLHKVFLSKYCYNVTDMHLHMLILFHHHIQQRQISPGSTKSEITFHRDCF
jgi:hypothetical protein